MKDPRKYPPSPSPSNSRRRLTPLSRGFLTGSLMFSSTRTSEWWFSTGCILISWRRRPRWNWPRRRRVADEKQGQLPAGLAINRVPKAGLPGGKWNLINWERLECRGRASRPCLLRSGIFFETSLWNILNMLYRAYCLIAGKKQGK